MILSERLEAVIGMVPYGSAVFDVGCDHGFVPIELVRRGISPCCVASDVREGPLRKAKEHICEYGLSQRIAAVLADGVPKDLSGLRNQLCMDRETQLTLITAGMGGLLMQSILENAEERLSEFAWCILSPQRNPESVRKTLRKLGFCITDERMVLEDGKYYPVIKAGRADQGDEGAVFAADDELLSECCDRYGPLLLERRDGILLSYLMKEKKELVKISSEMLKSTHGGDAFRNVEERIRLCKKALEIMEVPDENFG